MFKKTFKHWPFFSYPVTGQMFIIFNSVISLFEHDSDSKHSWTPCWVSVAAMKCMQRIPLWKDKGPYGNILRVILAPSVGNEDKQAKFGIKSAESDNMEFLAPSWTPHLVLSCWACPNKHTDRQLAGNLSSLDGHLRDSLITQFRDGSKLCFCRTEGLSQCHLKGLWPVIISLPDSNFLFLWGTGHALCGNSSSLSPLLHHPFTFFIWNRASKQTYHQRLDRAPNVPASCPQLSFLLLFY